jgi:hypothetical protein
MQFPKVLECNNPDIEIDLDDVDRTLEYDETFNELKEIYPGRRMAKKVTTGLQPFPFQKDPLAFLVMLVYIPIVGIAAVFQYFC